MRRAIATAAAAVAVASLAPGAVAGPRPRAAATSAPAPIGTPPPPPTFRVGAAVVRLDPHVTTYAGGFGQSPPIKPGSESGDRLSVRALYISNGKRAVEIAVVDTQAEFAAYQEGAQYGISAARAAAARAIDGEHLGPHLAASDIIVQGTHSHSAPTLEGLWGPVPTGYLREVTDGETTALVEAASRARPAYLQFGTADATALDDVQVAQYDAFPGWADDPLLAVLRAVDASTGATIATYATVPAHPDIVCGSCSRRLTADYQGIVRAALQQQLGGVAIVGPATLGREETPVQATTFANAHVFARLVLDEVYSALSTAHVVYSDRIDSTEQQVTIAGTGVALLALVEANHGSDAQKRQVQSASGEYPIDRADTPPWQTGVLVGTPATALRIGDVAYVSMPGEPFPEVRLSLQRATNGATVVALSKGQDDLGYFYPSWVTPFTEFYPSDTLTNSASAFAGDDLIRAQAQNLRAIGFDVARAFPRPVGIRPVQQLAPGLQVVGGPLTTDAGASGRAVVQLLATYSPPDLPEGTLSYGPPVGGVDAGQKTGGPVTWLFGDGSTGHSGFHEFGGTDQKPLTVVHRYRVGSYAVHASVQSADGRAASTSFTVRVYPRLRVSVRVRRAGAGLLLTPVVRGGDGQLLAVRWRLPGGTVRWGSRLAVARGVRAVTVTVTDGTGSQLTVLSNLRA